MTKCCSSAQQCQMWHYLAMMRIKDEQLGSFWTQSQWVKHHGPLFLLYRLLEPHWTPHWPHASLCCTVTINLSVFLLFFSPIMLCVAAAWPCSRVLCPDDNVCWLLSSPLHPSPPHICPAAALKSPSVFLYTYTPFVHSYSIILLLFALQRFTLNTLFHLHVSFLFSLTCLLFFGLFFPLFTAYFCYLYFFSSTPPPLLCLCHWSTVSRGGWRWVCSPLNCVLLSLYNINELSLY